MNTIIPPEVGVFFCFFFKLNLTLSFSFLKTFVPLLHSKLDTPFRVSWSVLHIPFISYNNQSLSIARKYLVLLFQSDVTATGDYIKKNLY